MSSGVIPRGDYVTINVLNRGRRRHDFTFMGKKTPRIKPGGLGPPVRRRERAQPVPVRSTVDRGKRFRGSVTVG